MTSDTPLSLDEGAHHDVAEWEQAAAAVLRKAGRLGAEDPDHAVWDKLATSTLDGIRISPLGTPQLVADLPQPVRPPARGEGWDVRVLLDDPDARAANQALLTDLENGATSVLLRVGGSGIPVDALGTALSGVLLDGAAVVLDAPADPLGAARAFAEVAGGGRLAEGTNLGVDPVGARVRQLAPSEGQQPDSDPAAVVGEAGRVAEELGCRAVVADGTAVHDLGASDAQELGYLLAVGAQQLRALAGTGRDVAAAAALIELRVAATDEQFPTIAKQRAARRLWARVLELSGAPADRRHTTLHAVTSRPMMTRYDPWVNMLRTCVAAFAAGVGGADAVTVLPFDIRLGRSDGFARRNARNTSALLVAESRVAHVADPAGGSFAVEKLTDDLARAGWEEFGRLEQAGGVLAAIDDGSLRARIDQVVAERDRQIATRKRPLTGLSEFPNLHEVLPEREPRTETEPVRPYGHAFEQLRDDPVEEKVFLATMGPVAAHTARASFATNLFAAGGVDVVNEGRHDDVEAVLAHYRGEQVVCLAGNESAYADWGAALVAALRDAGAGHVIVAGAPTASTADLFESIDDSCALGVDALDFLRRTRETMR